MEWIASDFHEFSTRLVSRLYYSPADFHGTLIFNVCPTFVENRIFNCPTSQAKPDTGDFN